MARPLSQEASQLLSPFPLPTLVLQVEGHPRAFGKLVLRKPNKLFWRLGCTTVCSRTRDEGFVTFMVSEFREGLVKLRRFFFTLLILQMHTEAAKISGRSRTLVL